MLHIAKNLEYGIARNRNMSTAKHIFPLQFKTKEYSNKDHPELKRF